MIEDRGAVDAWDLMYMHFLSLYYENEQLPHTHSPILNMKDERFGALTRCIAHDV